MNQLTLVTSLTTSLDINRPDESRRSAFIVISTASLFRLFTPTDVLQSQVCDINKNNECPRRINYVNNALCSNSKRPSRSHHFSLSVNTILYTIINYLILL